MKHKLLHVLICLFTASLLKAQPGYMIHNPSLGVINDLIEMPNGNIWVASENGVFEYHFAQKIWAHHKTDISNIIARHKNEIWVGSNHKILRRVQNNWLEYDHNNSALPQNFIIKNIAFSWPNRVWFTTEAGDLFLFDGTAFILQNITAHHVVAQANLVYATNTGSESVGHIWNGMQWSELPKLKTSNQPENTFNPNIIHQTFIDANSNLYVINTHGIYKYNQNTWDTVYHTFPFNTIGIWEFTESKFYKLNRNHLIVYTQDTVEHIPNYRYDFISNPLSRVRCAKASLNKILLGHFNGEIFVAITKNLHSNNNDSLSSLDFKAAINPNGDLFRSSKVHYSDFNTHGRGKIHDKNAVFLAHSWLEAVINGDTSGIYDMYRMGGNFSFSGPIADVYDEDYVNRYNHVWYVNKQMIELHKQEYNNPNYEMPFGIAHWPGNGQMHKGVASHLAPYVDLNGNGIYDPHLGEYPDIRGTEAVYAISNDDRGIKHLGLESMKAEIHTMAYVIDTANYPEAKEAVFFHQKIYNRSATTWNHVRLGIFNNFDLEDIFTQSQGSDSTSGTAYTTQFNANNSAFGNHAPALVYGFLNKKAERILIYDEKNLSNFSDKHHSFVMSGSKIPFDCSPNTNHTSNKVLTNFRYNLSDSCFSQELHNGDIRTVASTSWPSIEPQQYACLDFIYVFGRDTLNTNQDSLASLRKAINNFQTLKQMYQGFNHDCLGSYVSHQELELPENKFIVYPNPLKAGSTLFISNNASIKNVNFYSIAGVRIHVQIALEGKEAKLTLPSTLSSGMYLAEVELNNHVKEIQRIFVY